MTSELTLKGPQRFAGKLPQPPGNVADYQDIAVQALPLPPGQRSARPQVTASSHQEPYPAANAGDGREETFWVSNGWQPGEAPTKQKPEWLRFDYPEPVKTKTLWLAPQVPYGPREIEVQVSEDGKTFTTVQSFSAGERGFMRAGLPGGDVQDLPHSHHRLLCRGEHPDLRSVLHRPGSRQPCRQHEA